MAPKTPQWILTTKPTKQLAAHSDAAELILDFKGLQRVSPAGLAALTAFMTRRERFHWVTDVVGLENCSIGRHSGIW